MIQTGKQTTQAIKEIVKTTKWTKRKIAEKADVNHTTIWLLSKGVIDNPTDATMEKVEILLNKVRDMEAV